MCNEIEMGVQVLIWNIKNISKYINWQNSRNGTLTEIDLLFILLHSQFSAHFSWLDAEISELGRDREFRFFAIASVECGGSTIIKFFPLGPGTLKVKNLYKWFQQCGCRFRVILEWGIRIQLNFQDQSPLDSGTLGTNWKKRKLDDLRKE